MERSRKRVRHFHEPGQLHEFTFSCYHRWSLLTNSGGNGDSAPCQGATLTPRHDSTSIHNTSRTLSLGTGAAAPSQWHPDTWQTGTSTT